MPPVNAMGYLSEKAAYLQGMAEGMKLAEKSDEGKMLEKVIDLMAEMAASVEEAYDVVEECEERIDDLEDYAEDISDILSGDCDCDCDSDHCDCGCEDEFDDDDDELDDVDFYEVKCPHCKEKVFFDEDMIDDGEFECPNCGEAIEIDMED